MALHGADARGGSDRSPQRVLAHGPRSLHDGAQRTGHAMKKWLRSLCGAGALLAAITGVQAGGVPGPRETFDVNEDNLLVVLRESPGANKQDEGLTPFG